jgi:hypothetical protein
VTPTDAVLYVPDDLRALVAGLRGTLTAKDHAYLQSLSRADEWGEALDLLLFLIERRARPVSDDARGRAYRLAAEIGLDLAARRRAWPK